MAELVGVDRPEGALAGIDPDAVWRSVVVADVEIGKPVAVDVAKHHSQSPVAIRRNGRALFVQESAWLVLGRLETSVTFVAIESVDFRQLAHFAVRQRFEATFPFRRTRGFAVHFRHFPLIAAAGHGEARRGIGQHHRIDEMCAVKVEVAVTINVRERHRCGGCGARQAGVLHFRPLRLAVVEEEPRAGGDAIDEEIEVVVAIHIRERGAAGDLIRARGVTDGQFLEAPLTEIAIEPVRALQVAEVNIGPSVRIDIADGDARAVVRYGVDEKRVARELIREPDLGGGGRQGGEADFGRSGRGDDGDAVALPGGPRQIRVGQSGQEPKHRGEEMEADRTVHDSCQEIRRVREVNLGPSGG